MQSAFTSCISWIVGSGPRVGAARRRSGPRGTGRGRRHVQPVARKQEAERLRGAVPPREVAIEKIDDRSFGPGTCRRVPTSHASRYARAQTTHLGIVAASTTMTSASGGAAAWRHRRRGRSATIPAESRDPELASSSEYDRLPRRSTGGNPDSGPGATSSPSGRSSECQPSCVDDLGDEAADIGMHAVALFEEDAAVCRDRRRRLRGDARGRRAAPARCRRPGRPGRAGADRPGGSHSEPSRADRERVGEGDLARLVDDEDVEGRVQIRPARNPRGARAGAERQDPCSRTPRRRSCSSMHLRRRTRIPRCRRIDFFIP